MIEVVLVEIKLALINFVLEFGLVIQVKFIFIQQVLLSFTKQAKLIFM